MHCLKDNLITFDIPIPSLHWPTSKCLVIKLDMQNFIPKYNAVLCLLASWLTWHIIAVKWSVLHSEADMENIKNSIKKSLKFIIVSCQLHSSYLVHPFNL